jgi:hypothetical protein
MQFYRDDHQETCSDQQFFTGVGGIWNAGLQAVIDRCFAMNQLVRSGKQPDSLGSATVEACEMAPKFQVLTGRPAFSAFSQGCSMRRWLRLNASTLFF